jgi:hypothetical protein
MLRRLFHVPDNQHRHGDPLRLEPQSQLLLEGFESFS